MWRKLVRGAAVGAISCLTAATAVARDGDPSACTGEVWSAVLRTFPADSVYRVDLDDDSLDNIHFRQAFLAAFSRSGRHLGDSGRLVVTFDVKTHDGGATRGRLAADANILVRDEDSGRVIWMANVHCRELSGTREQIVDSIIRAVIGVFGRTVARQTL